MFALAVYDPEQKRLLLARDRFGIKPLYFTETAGGLAFASELNALRMLSGVGDRIDGQALHDYLALHYVPGPSTIFRGVRCLEPGQMLIADHGRARIDVRVHRYHTWTVAPETTMTLEEATRRAGPLLEQAVCRQLESDVPLGSLLSGGIDSSLVSAAAQGTLRAPLHTFNVRFPERDFDETPAAVAVASHLGTRHQTLTVEAQSLSWGRVMDVLAAPGQPYADSSILAVDAVCASMRDHVTVALSGDGGDEGFGGYESFRRIEPINVVGRLPPRPRSGVLRVLAAMARPVSGRGPVPASLAARLEALARTEDPAGIIGGLTCWLPEAELRRLWRGGPVEPVSRLFEQRWRHELPPHATALERLSALLTEANARVRLPYDYLVKVDIASMRHGLEVRVPLLDEDLFELGLRLPHVLKTNRHNRKLVLRELARSWLPPSVVGLPKHGFTIPVDRSVDSEFREQVRSRLLGELLSGSFGDALDQAEVRRVVNAFLSGEGLDGVSRAGLYQRLIALMSLHNYVS